MLDYLLQYGLFLAEVTTVAIAIGVVIGFLYNPSVMPANIRPSTWK